jgi:retron-type reverse transcriptase
VQTSLQGIADKAKAEPKHRFQNLFGMIDKDLLLDSWRYLNLNAALGVDRVTAQEYAQDLEGNIERLVESLKEKRYRAKLIRRQYIPKVNGKLRPLGILVIEDKLLQCAATRILQAIYEQDFQPCSFGYREGVGAQDAVKTLTRELLFGRYGYVVEADIKGFFDHMSHQWIERMLKERIDDASMLWLIGKWLKAGVLDTDGLVIHSETGSPQGGVVTPRTQKVTWRRLVLPYRSGMCIVASSGNRMFNGDIVESDLDLLDNQPKYPLPFFHIHGLRSASQTQQKDFHVLGQTKECLLVGGINLETLKLGSELVLPAPELGHPFA